MIVILTNDDGIDAPGLAALEAACRGRAARLIVFDSQAAHDAYQVAERHTTFIAENATNWARVRVFDADVSHHSAAGEGDAAAEAGRHVVPR